MIIGREGEQPFQIGANHDQVSRHHCNIDMESNPWMLEDTSSMGTFVRDEQTGQFKEVDRVAIGPLTYVQLGPPNAHGFGFYARQLMAPGNYRAEFDYLNQKEDEYEAALLKVKNTSRLLNILKAVVPVLLLALSYLILPKDDMQYGMIIRMGASAVPTVLLQLFYDSTRRKKQLDQYMVAFRRCPKCGAKLKTDDIRNMQCPKTKCHAH